MTCNKLQTRVTPIYIHYTHVYISLKILGMGAAILDFGLLGGVHF